MEKNRFRKRFDRFNRNEHKHKWRKNYPFGIKSTCIMKCKICNAVQRVNRKKKLAITVTTKPLKPILTKVLISFFLLTFLAINVITAEKMICNNSDGSIYAIELFNKSIEKEMGLNKSNMQKMLNETCVIIPDNFNNIPIDCAFIIQKLNDNIIGAQEEKLALNKIYITELDKINKLNKKNVLTACVVILFLLMMGIFREYQWRKTN